PSKGKDKPEKQIKVPKIVVPNFEVSEDVEIDEEDIEFFKENSQLSGFLKKMDAVKLAKNEIIKAKKKTTTGSLKKGPTEQTADDVDSEPESVDSDLEGMDIDMDDSDEPMSEEEFDMEEGHYESVDEDSDDEGNAQQKIDDSDDEQDYEQAPRKAEGWSDKGSTRLPIKLADGRIKEVKDDRVRPSEVRDSDDEEADEEVADSDFAEEEEDDNEIEVEEPQTEKKIPKKVLLAKQKEEMASIAQAIIADPEGNCNIHYIMAQKKGAKPTPPKKGSKPAPQKKK
ncbi:hypothetical protein BGZ46_005667, partial [Entomortierella lignicola]